MDMVDPCWCGDDLPRIVTYLRNGHIHFRYSGHSFCRFQCGIAMAAMGNCDLCDGIWVWPEGLAHYVEHHSVRLPDAFVETMQARGWELPLKVALPQGCHFDLGSRSTWISWAQDFKEQRTSKTDSQDN
jgi:hypothetical protein